MFKNEHNIDVGVILQEMSRDITNIFSGLITLRSKVRHLIEGNILTYEELQQKIENIEDRLDKKPEYNNRIRANEEIYVEEGHYFVNKSISERLLKMEKITSTYVIFSEKDSEALGRGKAIKMAISEFKDKFKSRA